MPEPREKPAIEETRCIWCGRGFTKIQPTDQLCQSCLKAEVTKASPHRFGTLQ